MNKPVLAAIAAGTAVASLALAVRLAIAPADVSCCAEDAPAQLVSFSSARCTGSPYCNACSNCSNCAHCSNGGSCGVCARPVFMPVVPRVVPASPRRSPNPKPDKPKANPTPKPAPAPDPYREARSQLRMGQGMERMKNLKEAARYYRQALESDPNGAAGKEAAKSWTRLTGLELGPDAIVTAVIDAYTIKVRPGTGAEFEVRLLGVDPPNAAEPARTDDPLPRKATGFIESALLRQAIWLGFDPSHPRKDPNGRTYAYTYRKKDGLLINRQLISQGYGVATSKARHVFSDSFRAAERDARAAKAGIWGTDFIPAADKPQAKP